MLKPLNLLMQTQPSSTLPRSNRSCIGHSIEIRHLTGFKARGLKTIIGPDITGACPSAARIPALRASMRASATPKMQRWHCVTAAAAHEADSHLFFEATSAQWRFVFPQDRKDAVSIIKTHASDVTYTYFAAMPVFIGCREIELLEQPSEGCLRTRHAPCHVHFNPHAHAARGPVKMLDDLMAELKSKASDFTRLSLSETLQGLEGSNRTKCPP